MGTTLGNLHVLDGEIAYLKSLIPGARLGSWSKNFISAFSDEFLPEVVDKVARKLSSKIPQPILSVWIFDSDAVAFTVFQNGKLITSHIVNPASYNKMGNISRFCETLRLPPEDIARLRFIWKKGNAEEQLDLTACLMGLPFCHDLMEMPDKVFERDTEPVDCWIAERPAPKRIKNTAKIELIQEIPEFFLYRCLNNPQFLVGVTPYDDPGSAEREYHLWKARPDGSVAEIWASDGCLDFISSKNRVVCSDYTDGSLRFDSAGSLPKDFAADATLFLLEDGKILREAVDDQESILTCYSAEGHSLWTRSFIAYKYGIIGSSDKELLISNGDIDSLKLSQIELSSGKKIATIPHPVGLSIYQKVWHHNSWWITHDSRIIRDGVRFEIGCQITKLAPDLSITQTLALPSFTQGIFFSPDEQYVYIFIYSNQIIAVDAEKLTVENVMHDKAFFYPLGFDKKDNELRFWIQRDSSTVEAWNSLLTKPLSRHRLKGSVVNGHISNDGKLCVSTWDKKKCVFRVYRID